MKFKYYLIILLFLAFQNAYSQNISVKSFRMIENDLDARVTFPKMDQNGEKCAIIKVVTTEQVFIRDGDALGIISIDYKSANFGCMCPGRKETYWSTFG